MMYQTYTISDRARFIDPETASENDLQHAVMEAHIWRGHWPEDDDYELADWLDRRCSDELVRRAIAKFSGGVRPATAPR